VHILPLSERFIFDTIPRVFTSSSALHHPNIYGIPVHVHVYGAKRTPPALVIFFIPLLPLAGLCTALPPSGGDKHAAAACGAARL